MGLTTLENQRQVIRRYIRPHNSVGLKEETEPVAGGGGCIPWRTMYPLHLVNIIRPLGLPPWTVCPPGTSPDPGTAHLTAQRLLLKSNRMRTSSHPSSSDQSPDKHLPLRRSGRIGLGRTHSRISVKTVLTRAFVFSTLRSETGDIDWYHRFRLRHTVCAACIHCLIALCLINKLQRT